MFYLVKNGERVSFGMDEAEAKSFVEHFHKQGKHEWDTMEIDDEEVDVICFLSDLRDRFAEHDVDMYDLIDRCDDYVKLLELALDYAVNYHERRYLI